MIERIVKAGQKYGEIQVSISRAKEITLNYEQDTFSSATSGYSDSLKIKISDGKKFGFARTTDLSLWKDCLNTAVKVMKISPALPNKVVLSYPAKNKIYFSEKKIEKIEEEELEKMAGPSLDSALNKKVNVPALGITRVTEENYFGNSNQIFFDYKKSLLSFFLECVRGESSGSEGHVSRELFKPEAYTKEAVELCINGENPKQIKTMKADLILDYFAFSNLLASMLMPAFYADRVQNKRSVLVGKLGKKVFSDKLTIYDNGLLKNGLFSAPFDGEGTPMQKTVLVEKGIVKNMLYDDYTAAIDKTKSTGNCGDITKTPYVSASNFCIAPGKFSTQDIIAGTKQGVMAKYIMGGHFVNDITGDVSVGISNAFMIEKGKVTYPIKQTMISFNFFDALKKLNELSRTARQESHVSAPLVKLEGVQFIS